MLGKRLNLEAILSFEEEVSYIDANEIYDTFKISPMDMASHELTDSYISKYIFKNYSKVNAVSTAKEKTTRVRSIKNLISFLGTCLDSYDVYKRIEKYGLTYSAIYDLHDDELTSFRFMEDIYNEFQNENIDSVEFIEAGMLSTRYMQQHFREMFTDKKIIEIIDLMVENQDTFQLNTKYWVHKADDKEVVVRNLMRDSAKEIYKGEFQDILEADLHRLGIINAAFGFSKEVFESKVTKRVGNGDAYDEFTIKLLQ